MRRFIQLVFVCFSTLLWNEVSTRGVPNVLSNEISIADVHRLNLEQSLASDQAYLQGFTKIEDYDYEYGDVADSELEDQNWLDKNRNKRGLGPTGLKILRGALISVGVIHATSLTISTAKLAFDIWFNELQCCGPNPSICDDYKTYSAIKDRVLRTGSDIDKLWLLTDNAKSVLLSLSTNNKLLYGAINELDSKMGKVVTALKPELEEEIRNTTKDLKDLVIAKNETIANLTLLAQQLTVNIFADAFSNVLRSVTFLSDGYMMFWVVKTMKKFQLASIKTRARSNAVTEMYRSRSNAVTGIDSNAIIKKDGFWKRSAGVRSGLLTAASTGLTVYATVQDIIYVVTTLETCSAIASDTRKALDLMRPEEPKMYDLLGKVNASYVNFTGEFDGVRASLFNSKFRTFLIEVVKLAKNASNQTSDYVQACKDIAIFEGAIATADKFKTVELVELLTNALGKITHKFDCLTKLMNTFNYAIQQCSLGYRLDAIFVDAQKQQVQDAKVCVDNGYISKQQVRDYMDPNLIRLNFQTDCIRNNKNVKGRVCAGYVKDYNNSHIATLEGITTVQVEWFINVAICPPADVDTNIIKTICTSKDEDSNLTTVLVMLKKYDQTQVTSNYDACEIKTAKAALICEDKDYDYTLAELYVFYNLYPQAKVKAVFDNCPPKELNDGEKKQICDARYHRRSPKTWPHAYYYFLIENYGEAAVKAVYDACVPRGKKDFMPVSAQFHLKSDAEQKELLQLLEKQGYFKDLDLSDDNTDDDDYFKKK